MATEVDLTYLGRLFITQYVFKLDIRLQRLYSSSYSAIAAAPTVPPQTYEQQVHPRTLRRQQCLMFKGIHTLDTIKGIKGSD